MCRPAWSLQGQIRILWCHSRLSPRQGREGANKFQCCRLPPPWVTQFWFHPNIMGTDSSGAGATTGSLTVPNASSLLPKLTRWILAMEFIDMRELLPESWRSEPQQNGGASRTVADGPVRDFKLWTECFGTLAGVLTVVYPEKAPHLRAYLHMINFFWAAVMT